MCLVRNGLRSLEEFVKGHLLSREMGRSYATCNLECPLALQQCFQLDKHGQLLLRTDTVVRQNHARAWTTERKKTIQALTKSVFVNGLAILKSRLSIRGPFGKECTGGASPTRFATPLTAQDIRANYLAEMPQRHLATPTTHPISHNECTHGPC